MGPGLHQRHCLMAPRPSRDERRSLREDLARGGFGAHEQELSARLRVGRLAPRPRPNDRVLGAILVEVGGEPPLDDALLVDADCYAVEGPLAHVLGSERCLVRSNRARALRSAGGSRRGPARAPHRASGRIDVKGRVGPTLGALARRRREERSRRCKCCLGAWASAHRLRVSSGKLAPWRRLRGRSRGSQYCYGPGSAHSPGASRASNLVVRQRKTPGIGAPRSASALMCHAPYAHRAGSPPLREGTGCGGHPASRGPCQAASRCDCGAAPPRPTVRRHR